MEGELQCGAETQPRSQPSSQGLLGTEGRRENGQTLQVLSPGQAGRLTHHPLPPWAEISPDAAEALQLWPRAPPNPRAMLRAHCSAAGPPACSVPTVRQCHPAPPQARPHPPGQQQRLLRSAPAP